MASQQSHLRPVGAEERGETPKTVPTLEEAVESGDVLDMLLAQRRLIAQALSKAGDSVRPQLSNELNKLHVLIADEQARRAAVEAEADRDDEVPDEACDASAF